MKEELQVLNEHIVRRRLKKTQQRETILEVFLQSKRHMTVEELHNQVKYRDPTIGLTTVYRTIKLFDELAITKFVWFGSNSKIELSEDFVEHHHHIVCQSCGRIEKIDQTAIEKTILKTALKKRYKLTGHHVEILGLCRDCQTKTLGKS